MVPVYIAEITKKNPKILLFRRYSQTFRDKCPQLPATCHKPSYSEYTAWCAEIHHRGLPLRSRSRLYDQTLNKRMEMSYQYRASDTDAQ